MADQPKQINFTIIPDDAPAEGDKSPARTYSNFCSIAHTPFDFRAPVRARIVVPVQFVPNLISALQEHWRVFSESYSNVGWNKGPGPIH
jgi:hypothetical protein